MIVFDGGTYFSFHITIPKRHDIEKFNLKIYSCQSLISMGEIIWVGNERFFYFNDDGKLDIYYRIEKKNCEK